jgi:hypothetical protein
MAPRILITTNPHTLSTTNPNPDDGSGTEVVPEGLRVLDAAA